MDKCGLVFLKLLIDTILENGLFLRVLILSGKMLITKYSVTISLFPDLSQVAGYGIAATLIAVIPLRYAQGPRPT